MPTDTNLSANYNEETNQFDTEDSNDTSQRRLAIVTRIKAVKPIDGADRIECVTFQDNGWQCVAGKGEFKVGHLCVFFEIDAFLPKDERYSVLEGRCNKTMKGVEGYRLKSARFKSCISQGLALPLSAFPEIDPLTATNTDVTEALGVKLYQLPVIGGKFGFNIGRPLAGFPHFVKKTDQERLQGFGTRQILDFFRDVWEKTEKLDGTSITLYCQRIKERLIGGVIPFAVSYKFGVCSRNLELKQSGKETVEYTRWIGGDNEPLKDGELFVQDDEGNIAKSECGTYCKVKGAKETEVNSIYWDMARKYHIQERLEQFCKENDRQLALQGEIVGVGIQKNPLNLPDNQLFVFDIWDIDLQRYVPSSERRNILNSLNEYETESPKIQSVPVLDYDRISPTWSHIQAAYRYLESLDEDLYESEVPVWERFLSHLVGGVVEDLVKDADGETFNGRANREGIVYKSTQDAMRSFKVISNSHLLSLKE